MLITVVIIVKDLGVIISIIFKMGKEVRRLSDSN